MSCEFVNAMSHRIEAQGEVEDTEQCKVIGRRDRDVARVGGGILMIAWY
jgi:hypothetical protein